MEGRAATLSSQLCKHVRTMSPKDLPKIQSSRSLTSSQARPSISLPFSLLLLLLSGVTRDPRAALASPVSSSQGRPVGRSNGRFVFVLFPALPDEGAAVTTAVSPPMAAGGGTHKTNDGRISITWSVCPASALALGRRRSTPTFQSVFLFLPILHPLAKRPSAYLA